MQKKALRVQVGLKKFIPDDQKKTQSLAELSKVVMDLAEEVKKLKISSGTLQNLRISGKLHYSKIGGTYYYRSEDIENLLEGTLKSEGNGGWK